MFKNLNRTYIFLSILLIGTCSSVFAIDFSQALSQANEQSAWIDSLFKWKASISNLYSKALKLVKDKEVVAASVSFDQLQIYFNTCTNIKTSDFINILYSSNPSFKNTFDLILPSWTKKPTVDDVKKTYIKFFACRKISTPTLIDISNLNHEINTVNYDAYSNAYTMSTLNKTNFGSDLFWNGTLDDSNFDLLYDINQVGKILFEWFTDAPQLLFYSMPKSPTNSNGGGSSSSNQSAYQLWGGGGSFPGTTWSPIGGSNNTSPWWWSTSTTSSSTTSSSTTTTTTTTSPLADQEVQKFIESTNPSVVSSPAGVALLFWNQCVIPDTPPPAVEEPPLLMTPEEYMSGISSFIANANVDEVINTSLLTQFTTNNPLPSGWSTSDSWYADAIANAYAEQMFGAAAPGTCEYSCNSLSLDKQAQCQLACAKSCIQTCSDTHTTTQSSCASAYTTTLDQCNQLSLIKKAACVVSAVAQKTSCTTQATTDQLLCVSDCTCILVAWPNGKWWEKMENMFRLKFCKVPVQAQQLKPGKTVYSIQGIFQEISDVLAWLRDSGQMVKLSKTKEFLDGTIKIKFADNFAFKLQVWFKPVFAQRSTTVKIQEQSQANADLNVGVLDMNASAPEADNYNKYIVVSDYNSNEADLKPVISLSDINKNIEEVTAADVKSKEAKLSADTIDGVLTSYIQNTNVLFVQNMIGFLKDNQQFLQNLSEALLDMTKMSLEFKTKIENSK